MAIFTTLDPTNVTTNSATIRGSGADFPPYDISVWFERSWGSPINYGYVEPGTYTYGVSGLAENTWYWYRLKYYNGVTWGFANYIYFQTDTSAVPVSKAAAASSTPYGTATRSIQNPPTLRYPSSSTTPSGSVSKTVQAAATVAAATSSTTPVGEATADVASPSAVAAVAAGECTPTGSVTANITVEETAALTASSTTPTGGASVQVQHPLPSGGEALAARYDFIIEQGASFSKVFQWQDSDGDGIVLTNYTIRMAIRPYRGSDTVLASSSGGITIEKSTTVVGGFTVSMTAAVTAGLDFIRAVYDIEADTAGMVSRLVQGYVYLKREVTT